MIITIGRTNGPCCDRTVELTVSKQELEIVKDTLAAVNTATNNREKWFVAIEDEDQYIIPTATKN